MRGGCSGQGAQAPVTPAGLILERLRFHEDKTERRRLYRLRLIAANYLDLTTPSAARFPKRQDGEFGKVTRTSFEEGTHSWIATDTQLKAKSMTLSEPDIKWTDCRGDRPEVTAAVRRAYYLQEAWRRLSLSSCYTWKILDLVIGGAASSFFGFRDGRPFVEYGDALDVTWDRAFDEPHRKRWVFLDRHLPFEEALRHYPRLSEFRRPPAHGSKGLEETVTVTCYYDADTSAALYSRRMLDGPKLHGYGRIPARLDVLMQEQSLAHGTGLVEGQIGSHRLGLRLQRSFRETALRAVPVGLARGDWDEADLDRLQEGEEGLIMRAKSSSAEFDWKSGGEIQASQIEAYRMAKQDSNAASGTTDFAQSRTDTKVDFASQLALLAEMSGSIGKHTEGVVTSAVKEDARAYMGVASRLEDEEFDLKVGAATLRFGPDLPIGPLLGEDGEVEVAPMQFRSPAQKLQDVGVLGSVLAQARSLPPGLQGPYVDAALTAFEVDDKDVWMEAMQSAEEQIAASQASQPQAPVEALV